MNRDQKVPPVCSTSRCDIDKQSLPLEPPFVTCETKRWDDSVAQIFLRTNIRAILPFPRPFPALVRMKILQVRGPVWFTKHFSDVERRGIVIHAVSQRSEGRLRVTWLNLHAPLQPQANPPPSSQTPSNKVAAWKVLLHGNSGPINIYPPGTGYSFSYEIH